MKVYCCNVTGKHGYVNNIYFADYKDVVEYRDKYAADRTRILPCNFPDDVGILVVDALNNLYDICRQDFLDELEKYEVSCDSYEIRDCYLLDKQYEWG